MINNTEHVSKPEWKCWGKKMCEQIVKFVRKRTMLMMMVVMMIMPDDEFSYKRNEK